MTSAREVIARALLIHDEPKARLEDQSAAEQERYRTEAKWFERYLEAEGLTVQTADEVDARIAEAVAGERERCARIADERAKQSFIDTQMRCVFVAENIAAAIRGADHD